MLRKFRSIALASLVLGAAGCPSNNTPAPAVAEPAPTAPAEGGQVAIEHRQLPVKCGCKLEVKKCSEWAEVDGQWVQLTGDHGLGSMPFCGKENLQARIDGHLKDGKLHVTSIEMVQ